MSVAVFTGGGSSSAAHSCVFRATPGSLTLPGTVAAAGRRHELCGAKQQYSYDPGRRVSCNRCNRPGATIVSGSGFSCARLSVASVVRCSSAPRSPLRLFENAGPRYARFRHVDPVGRRRFCGPVGRGVPRSGQWHLVVYRANGTQVFVRRPARSTEHHQDARRTVVLGGRARPRNYGLGTALSTAAITNANSRVSPRSAAPCGRFGQPYRCRQCPVRGTHGNSAASGPVVVRTSRPRPYWFSPPATGNRQPRLLAAGRAGRRASLRIRGTRVGRCTFAWSRSADSAVFDFARTMPPFRSANPRRSSSGAQGSTRAYLHGQRHVDLRGRFA